MRASWLSILCLRKHRIKGCLPAFRVWPYYSARAERETSQEGCGGREARKETCREAEPGTAPGDCASGSAGQVAPKEAVRAAPRFL